MYGTAGCELITVLVSLLVSEVTRGHRLVAVPVHAAGVVHGGAVLQLLLLRANVVGIVRLALVLGVVRAKAE